MRSSSPIRKDENPNGKLNCQKTKEKKLGSVRGKAGLRGLIEVKRREKGKGRKREERKEIEREGKRKGGEGGGKSVESAELLGSSCAKFSQRTNIILFQVVGT